MAAPKSGGKKGRDAMRAAVREHWVKGWSDVRIGQVLGITGEAVGYHRRKLIREEQRAAADGVARRAEQAAVLRHTRNEALDAWERSKAILKTTTKEQAQDEPLSIGADGQVKGGGSKTSRVKLTEEETAGGAIYLRVAMEAMKAERDLLGLDAVKVVRFVMVNGKRIDIEDERQLDALTRAELEVVAIEVGLKP